MVRACACVRVAMGARQREPKKEMPDWAKMFSSSNKHTSKLPAPMGMGMGVSGRPVASGLADSGRRAIDLIGS
jgi:hypothetical protein